MKCRNFEKITNISFVFFSYFSKTIKTIRVRLGEYDFLSQNETESVDSNVTEIKIHRDYDPATQQHDIALLKLNKTIKYNQFIRPVCLPTVQIKVNQTAIVTGNAFVLVSVNSIAIRKKIF